MSELDLLRKIADLEARLARLESAGAPYTTTSAGAMTTPALNLGTATGATAGDVYVSGDIRLTATAKKLYLTRSTGALQLSAMWYGDASTGGVSAGNDLFIGASNDIYLYSHGAGVNLARFDTSKNAYIYGGLNLGSATGVTAGAIALQDGITAPGTSSGAAIIYVDTADGDLKIKFGDGTVKTIATDT